MRRLCLVPFLALVLIGCSGGPSPVTSGSPSAMNLIALLSDFGGDDAYLAQMKGSILTVNPSARLLDLTHTIEPFNIAQGAYLLDQSAEEFPAGTVFVAIVDPGVGTHRESILVKTKAGKFYVGPNNGLFSSVLAREGLDQSWLLDKPEFFHVGVTSATFYGRDVFGPVAAHLTLGQTPEQLGTELDKDKLVLLPVKNPTLAGRTLTLTLVYLDHYGNLITNLASTDDGADRFQEGSLVKIILNGNNYSAPLVKTYADVPKGRLALLFNSSGQLELTVNQGSAAKQLKAAVGDSLYLHL